MSQAASTGIHAPNREVPPIEKRKGPVRQANARYTVLAATCCEHFCRT